MPTPVHADAGDPRFAAIVLSGARPGAADLAWAYGALALCALAFAVLASFADLPLPRADWFVPINQAALIICDALTAVLLFGQLRVARDRAVLVLAAGYVFSACMAAVHLMTFPGVFAPQGLLGGGSQSTAYLFITWHAGFPLVVLAYTFLKGRAAPLASVRGAVVQTLAIVALAVVGIGWLTIVWHDQLPPVLSGTVYAKSFLWPQWGQWTVAGLVLAVQWRQRTRSVLDLWLCVVLAAWFIEIGLVAIFNAGRYDLGFYTGRFFALVAASFVLIMLVLDQLSLYADLAAADVAARSHRVLQRDRDVLRLALQSGGMAAWSRDAVSGAEWWSDELRQLLGSTPLSSGRLADYIHAGDAESFAAALLHDTAADAPVRAEFRVRVAAGGWRWMEASGATIVEADGSRRQYVVFSDITRRKDTEAAEQALESNFKTLANGIAQLAWMARPDGWIYWYNDRWYAYTGTTEAEMEGWGWQRVHDPAVLPDVMSRWQRSVQTGTPFDMVFPLRGADGVFRPFLTRVSPLLDASGRVLHWFGTNTDISAQRQAEEALREADQRKNAFIATLGHELRNPLAPIRTASELLLRTQELPATARRAAAMIERQASHLARMVDDLLEVSRITQGKLQLRRAPVSIRSCLEDAVVAVEEPLRAAGHAMQLHLGTDRLDSVGDSTRLTQAFVNLLLNAVKFTPAGGHIDLRATREASDAVITITDDGIGIEPQHLERVFEMFAQPGEGGGRREGLGIGLALVRGFIQLHSGSVVALSAGSGKGSRFVVRLPLVAAKAPDEVRPAPQRTDDVASRRVLIVDDNVDAANSLMALLELAGHVVAVAHSGAAGIEQAFAFEPDVVLLDLGLPDISGLEVARALHSRLQEAVPVIVALTGWGQVQDREKTRAAGFDVHLTKPAEFEQLQAILSLPGPTQAGARPTVRH